MLTRLVFGEVRHARKERENQLDLESFILGENSKTTHSRYDNSRHMNILHFFATLSRIVSKEFTMLLIFFIVS